MESESFMLPSVEVTGRVYQGRASDPSQVNPAHRQRRECAGQGYPSSRDPPLQQRNSGGDLLVASQDPKGFVEGRRRAPYKVELLKNMSRRSKQQGTVAFPYRQWRR